VEEELEIRSDEVQEILTAVPSWMIRWGISLIFIILILCFVLSYFIKYPDVISGTVTLTTETPPVKLVPKTNGEIDQLYVEENQHVEAGEVIAQIRNPLSKDAIIYLEEFVQIVEQGLEDEFDKPLSMTETEVVFGAVQNDYNEVLKTIADYRFSIQNGQYLTRKRILEKQIVNYRQLSAINSKQLQFADQNFKLATETYESNKSLYEKNILSKAEFYEQEKMYTGVKNEIENLKKNQVQNAITLTDYERQLNEMEIEFLTKKMNLTKIIETRLNNIRNEINNWEESFVITAAIAGKVTFIMQVVENQFVAAGKELFAIVPDETNELVGIILVDKTGYGKVELGQSVQLKFDNYPSSEYGQVLGQVTHISPLPNEEKYLVKIALQNGLETTYKKQLTYSPEMSGQANIITEDLRILDRIFNQFRTLFDK